MPVTIGFDLDMTLVDSRAGIAATIRATLAEDGRDATDERIWPLIGIPLEDTFLVLAPDADPVRLADRYRELFPALGAPRAVPLTGAREALAAVRSAGGRVLVVSAKVEAAVRDVLGRVGLGAGPVAPDLVVGGLFAQAKGVRLAAEGADAYVGDHPGDMAAARFAGAVAVGVATGPASPTDLVAAGAEVVLTDLREFPAWLSGMSGRRSQPSPGQLA